jgi:hypothetical protein
MSLLWFFIFTGVAGLCFGGTVELLSKFDSFILPSLGFVLFIVGCVSMSMGIIAL